MTLYRLTPAATEDLFDVWAHVAQGDVPAADRIEQEIYDACRKLAHRPDLGHFRRDLTERPVRFFTVRRTYLIVFDPSAKPLQVLRILHGARDARAELAQQPDAN